MKRSARLTRWGWALIGAAILNELTHLGPGGVSYSLLGIGIAISGAGMVCLWMENPHE